MLGRIITELGPWSWWVLGMLLLAAELVMPGVFLVWIGLGAILTGAVSLLLWDAGFWTWQVQSLLFAASAIAFTLAAAISRATRRTVTSRSSTSGAQASSAARRSSTNRSARVVAAFAWMTRSGWCLGPTCRAGQGSRLFPAMAEI